MNPVEFMADFDFFLKESDKKPNRDCQLSLLSY